METATGRQNSIKLLDICCGAGGAAVGYMRAGLNEITGIDIDPQPNYPFVFTQMDLRDLDYEFLDQFDLIHASPPCQQYSRGSALARKQGKSYPDLIHPTRQLLIACGKPYIIENVLGAPLRADITLCGTMFGLGVLRHRYFETNIRNLASNLACNHQGMVKTGEYVTVAGNGGGGSKKQSDWAAAMGIDWMTRDELKEAVPPFYTQYLGEQIQQLLIYGSLELKPPLTRDWKIRRPHHSPKITYPVRLPGF